MMKTNKKLFVKIKISFQNKINENIIKQISETPSLITKKSLYYKKEIYKDEDFSQILDKLILINRKYSFETFIEFEGKGEICISSKDYIKMKKLNSYLNIMV